MPLHERAEGPEIGTLTPPEQVVVAGTGDDHEFALAAAEEFLQLVRARHGHELILRAMDDQGWQRDGPQLFVVCGCELRPFAVIWVQAGSQHPLLKRGALSCCGDSTEAATRSSAPASRGTPARLL